MLRNLAIKRWLGRQGWAGGDPTINFPDTRRTRAEMTQTKNAAVRDSNYKLGKPLPHRGGTRGI